MFRDTDAWPPAPDGASPPPPRPTSRRERQAMIAVALLLVAVVVGPFAGTSAVMAIVALVKSLAAAVRL